MKIIKFLILFWCSGSGLTLYLKSAADNQKLAKSICKITNDVKSLKAEPQDILISDLGGGVWASTVNNIVKCLDDKKAIVVADFKTKVTEVRLKKASVLILAGFDHNNHTILTKLFAYAQPPSIYTHMTKIICIISDTTVKAQRKLGLMKFSIFGLLNVALVHANPNGDIIYETINAQSNSVAILVNPISNTIVFPDKLVDLSGFQYEIAVFHQPPSVIATDNFVRSHMLHFLYALRDIQKVKIRINFINNTKILNDYWKRRKFHLYLNYGYVTNALDTKLMNYDKKSYCALIPIPHKTSLFQLVIAQPFDGLIWVFFGVSMVSSVAVWRMFRGRGAVDSHWKLAVGIFMMFIGQGAEFSRKNRFVLAVLLNFICLSVFLLSNLYEGTITSFMIEPAHENRLKTVEDLLASNFDVRSTKAFAQLHRNLSFFKFLEPKLIPSDKHINPKDIVERLYVFIRLCDDAETILNTRTNDGHLVSDYYYLLPEQLTWSFVQLEASYLNPFVERMQYFMDLSFQAGLPYMWKVFERHDYSRLLACQNHNESQLLEFKDLKVVFRILVVGFGLAFFVLLAEIFCHDCLLNFSFKKEINLMFYKITKMCPKKQKKVKIFSVPNRSN